MMGLQAVKQNRATTTMPTAQPVAHKVRNGVVQAPLAPATVRVPALKRYLAQIGPYAQPANPAPTVVKQKKTLRAAEKSAQSVSRIVLIQQRLTKLKVLDVQHLAVTMKHLPKLAKQEQLHNTIKLTKMAVLIKKFRSRLTVLPVVKIVTIEMITSMIVRAQLVGGEQHAIQAVIFQLVLMVLQSVVVQQDVGQQEHVHLLKYLQ